MFLRILILSAFAGVFIGVLAMAITILVKTMAALAVGASAEAATGMDITAVIFVLFSVVGWLVTAALAWRKLKSRPAQPGSDG